ncbi:cyclin-like protein [Lentinula edodes]|nr:cyclin-like protein [Lentinula edodes]
MTRARTQASSLLAENARATATTVASRAKTVETGGEKTSVKRKREILGEVTESNSGKPKASAKGKEKATSGDKAGPTATASKSRLTSKTARAPLREVGGTASIQKPLRDEVMIDETRAPAPLHATQPAIFKLVPQTSAHKDLLPRAPASLRDDVDREPVFKKRITEDREDRQPVARVTPRLPTTLDDSQLDEDRIATELADVHEDEDGAGLWDDLDADDAEDPFMAPEYVHEIMEYMKELEIRTAPTPDYMDYHSELDWEKRFILIEWILSIHSRYNFLAESFFLFVNVMDRFLSLRPTVALSKLQLVGVSCFCAAVKFEEGVAPSTEELVLLTGEIYSADEICKAERYVLKTIDWDLSFPGPMSWLRRGSKADDLDPVARTFAKYLLELACFAPELVATPSSLVAATSLWLARLTLGREEWVEVLYKKYASRKFMKCSVYVRKWALARFEAGAEVDLIAELPGIKTEIVESRNAKIAAGDPRHT